MPWILGTLRRQLHGFLADHLAVAETAIDHQQRAKIGYDFGMPVRQHLPRRGPVDIFRNADDAVRVMPHEAGFDQMLCNSIRFLRIRSGSAENAAGKLPASTCGEIRIGIRRRIAV